MSTSKSKTKRVRTTLVKNKQEIVEGRHVIDITDERLAARRREDYEMTLGHLSSIHRHEGPTEPTGVAGLLRRMTGRSKH